MLWIVHAVKRITKVFINPEIVEKSDETLRDTEGCLSAPGKQGDVKRHIRIILKYQDQDGKEQRKTFYNLEARCIQHEDGPSRG